MPNMARRDPNEIFRRMELDMHRFTEEALRAFLETPGAGHGFWQPAADIHETKDGWTIKLELAGVGADSVSVLLTGDGRRLVVSGHRKEDPEDRRDRVGCRQLEVYFGPFERTFVLPEGAQVDRDAIRATMRNGFLNIHLPRRSPQGAVRIIPIEVEVTR
jgi:HSP20 family protein